MSNLSEEILSFTTPEVAADSVVARFRERVAQGLFTRDENSKSHFCAYFIPYNPATKKVFIIHHKKAKLWLFPGGHIDKGESFLETLNREIHEELGVENAIKGPVKPFLIGITSIENAVQSCKEHLDTCFSFKTDGSNFNVDSKEFLDSRWTTVSDARKLMIDPLCVEVLNKMEELFQK
ncbi:MAG: NUDIX domain-containing protein [Patescibacteria group bacterium]